MAGKDSLKEVTEPKTGTKKKRKGNPGKGSNFERELAKTLSLWASGGQHDDWIWRTAGSGGRAKNRAKQGKTTQNSYGDLKPEHKEAFFLFEHCVFEAKNGYKGWCILDVIDSIKERKNQKTQKIQTIEAFAIQVKQDCENAKAKYPVIITKKDKHEKVIWIPRPLFKLLRPFLDFPYILFSGNEKMGSYVALNFDLFFSRITPEIFRENVK